MAHIELDDNHKKLISILDITVPIYNEQDKLYVVSCPTFNKSLQTIVHKDVPFRDQNYARRQYKYVEDISKVELNDFALSIMKEIEEADKQAKLMAEVAKSLRIGLRKCIDEEIEKGAGNEN
jgi:hypothetical protein